MLLTDIHLNSQLSFEHQRVLLRYLSDDLYLSYSDWVTLVKAVNILGDSTVRVNGIGKTFRQFYEQQIDSLFADEFLNKLALSTALERDGPRLQAETAKNIGELFDSMDGFTREDNDCRMLLTYCLYWWAAFGRGYIFEVKVFRDLEASGIQFAHHDITNRKERLSPYDIRMLSLRGDIKHTTYFLSAERLAKLVSDFFITRWYLGKRQWVWVVLLRPLAWAAINGKTTQATLDDVKNLLPQVLEIQIGSFKLVVLQYNDWKRRVKIKQQEGG